MDIVYEVVVSSRRFRDGRTGKPQKIQNVWIFLLKLRNVCRVLTIHFPIPLVYCFRKLVYGDNNQLVAEMLGRIYGWSYCFKCYCFQNNTGGAWDNARNHLKQGF
jgi:Na+/H+-translocating membrane pyrophosphatase